MRPALFACMAVCTALLFALPAHAQEAVHAVSGVVTAVNAQAHTLTVTSDDGAVDTFSAPATVTASLDFDSNVRTETAPAAAFNKTQDVVVVFFYGNTAVPTAVAVQDLGPAPIRTVTGTVAKYDKHTHAVTVSQTSGKKGTYQIGPRTVADSPTGVEQGDRFTPEKGDDVHMTLASTGNDVLFLHE